MIRGRVLDGRLASTLLMARGLRHLIGPFLNSTLSSQACRIEWTDEERFRQAATLMIDRIDHPWSFTDCLSFQLMKTNDICDALTKDGNFEEAGYVALLRD